jgi:hypothetical protein
VQLGLQTRISLPNTLEKLATELEPWKRKSTVLVSDLTITFAYEGDYLHWYQVPAYFYVYRFFVLQDPHYISCIIVFKSDRLNERAPFYGLPYPQLNDRRPKFPSF